MNFRYHPYLKQPSVGDLCAAEGRLADEGEEEVLDQISRSVHLQIGVHERLEALQVDVL